jgi:hypothetical protein
VHILFLIMFVAGCRDAGAQPTPAPVQGLDPATVALIQALNQGNETDSLMKLIQSGGPPGVLAVLAGGLSWIIRGAVKGGITITIRTETPVTVQLAPEDRAALGKVVDTSQQLGSVTAVLEEHRRQLEWARDWRHDELAPMIAGLQADILSLSHGETPTPSLRNPRSKGG